MKSILGWPSKPCERPCLTRSPNPNTQEGRNTTSSRRVPSVGRHFAAFGLRFESIFGGAAYAPNSGRKVLRVEGNIGIIIFYYYFGVLKQLDYIGYSYIYIYIYI